MMVASEPQQTWSKAQQSPPPWCRQVSRMVKNRANDAKGEHPEGPLPRRRAHLMRLVMGIDTKSLKRCSTFSRGEEGQDLLPFPLSSQPSVQRSGCTWFELWQPRSAQSSVTSRSGCSEVSPHESLIGSSEADNSVTLNHGARQNSPTDRDLPSARTRC